MTQDQVFTVAEMAKFVGVTTNTVYSDEKRGAVYASLNYPKRFTHREVTEYRVAKVEQFFDRMEEFRGRTGVNTVALAFAFGIDPSLFSHWKRGVYLPLGATMLQASQILSGTDREVVERIMDKLGSSKLDYKGVATLDKLSKIFRDLPVDDNGTTSAWVLGAEKALAEQTKAEKSEAVKDEKGQHKHKREHTVNVLDSTMRHNIIDWMYREGKSNSYVARMVGVSSGVVAGWLKGKPINMPNLIKMESLCQEHGIPMNEKEANAFNQPVVQSVDTVEEGDEVEDDDVEDDDFPAGDAEFGGVSEEREAFLMRTQELTIALFEAQEQFRNIRRDLMDHLEGELNILNSM